MSGKTIEYALVFTCAALLLSACQVSTSGTPSSASKSTQQAAKNPKPFDRYNANITNPIDYADLNTKPCSAIPANAASRITNSARPLQAKPYKKSFLQACKYTPKHAKRDGSLTNVDIIVTGRLPIKHIYNEKRDKGEVAPIDNYPGVVECISDESSCTLNIAVTKNASIQIGTVQETTVKPGTVERGTAKTVVRKLGQEFVEQNR